MDAAVDRLIEHVSINVLRKPDLQNDDIVTVSGRTEFDCSIFKGLCHGEWFDVWLLSAGMEMSDKPSFVRYDHSIPLDEEKRNQIRPIPRPFARWRNQIELWKEELGKRGESADLVYLCPVNSNCNHFTVLEINEQDRKIYHYDSNAPKGVIDGIMKSTRVRKLVQVSQTSTSSIRFQG